MEHKFENHYSRQFRQNHQPGRRIRDLLGNRHYPTALGRSRDPFSSFFGGSSFGASGLLKQMMDDDLFASPFGRRLTVSESRPIVAEAKTDSTRVLPVPTAGRPADYRGAVEQYRIVTEAEPVTVDAGDPITLRIGIVGDGPMDLVEAPPLADIEAITSDFKVTDQSLAGSVHDETKMFVTTLRPRREGISEIPPIPLSYLSCYSIVRNGHQQPDSHYGPRSRNPFDGRHCDQHQGRFRHHNR